MSRRARRKLADLVDAESADRILAEAEATYRATAALAPKARLGARHLLLMSSYAIALHQAMIDRGFEPERADDLTADIVFDSIRPVHRALRSVGRSIFRRPLNRARWLSRLSRRFYYAAPDWQMTEVAVEDGFGFDIDRCVVAEFFESFGLADLCQTAICDQDPRIAAFHGAAFERSGTLASGASHCDFRYHIGTT